MGTEFFLISRTQNVYRLKKKAFIVHFPGKTNGMTVCNKWAPHGYRHLDVKIWKSDGLIICEDCLTHSGEH